MSSPLHRPGTHESGEGHVTGKAHYVDDLPTLPGSLVAMAFQSPVPCGRIVELDISAAKARAGVHAVLTAADIPGAKRVGAIIHDDRFWPWMTFIFGVKPLPWWWRRL